jgi:hypothetical protein
MRAAEACVRPAECSAAVLPMVRRHRGAPWTSVPCGAAVRARHRLIGAIVDLAARAVSGLLGEGTRNA